MMTPQERLVAYMEAKCDLLPKGCRQLIFCEDDRTDLLGWNEHNAVFVVKWLKKVLAGDHHHTDAHLCPWCLLYCLECKSCSYALRHGRCDGNKFDNDYWAALILCAEAPGRKSPGCPSFADLLEPHFEFLHAVLTESTE